MLTYPAFKSVLKATFYGADASSAKCANVTPATLMRPEGKRHYLMALPSQAASGKRPFVIVIHGAGASAKQVLGMAFPPSPLSMWLEIAEREQVVVAAPDAGAGGWSDCFASASRIAKKDDVGFISAMIDKAIAESDVDPERVYVMGVSRGGFMAYRVATEIAHRLGAFSVVLASMPPPGRGAMPTIALSALVIGCTADPLIPYYGGKYVYTLGFIDPVSSIEDSVKVWRELGGLSGEPAVADIAQRNAGNRTRATRFMWGDCPDKLQVGLFKIENAGHAEPSRVKRYPRFLNWLVGAQNADVEVAEAAWEFFKHKRSGLGPAEPAK